MPVQGREGLNQKGKKLAELFFTFARIGAFTFGGGYAMLALLDNECVEKKRWISAEEFMELTVIAESTPGPVAINAATYTGYKRAGMAGAVAATFGMVLPSFLILYLISLYFEQFFAFTVVQKAFQGIRCAVALLIIRAALGMLKKMLKMTKHRAVSLSFATVFVTISLVLNFCNVSLSTIYLIVVSGFLGFCLFGLLDRKAGHDRV